LLYKPARVQIAEKLYNSLQVPPLDLSSHEMRIVALRARNKSVAGHIELYIGIHFTKSMNSLNKHMQLF
jgi:hypothetical protein